jgi:hypothetical protein
MPERELLLIGGLSASGKTMMAEHLQTEFKKIGIEARRPVCYTTRKMRGANSRFEGEVNGRDYFFIDHLTFDNFFATRINGDPPGTWDADQIGGDWYFNKVADTIPTKDAPISILPVHFSFVPEMRARYSNLDITIAEVHILIPPKGSVHEQWKKRLEIERPGRRYIDEVLLQDQTIEAGVLRGPTFTPIWCLDTDKQAFTNLIHTSLGLL